MNTHRSKHLCPLWPDLSHIKAGCDLSTLETPRRSWLQGGAALALLPHPVCACGRCFCRLGGCACVSWSSGATGKLTALAVSALSDLCSQSTAGSAEDPSPFSPLREALAQIGPCWNVCGRCRVDSLLPGGRALDRSRPRLKGETRDVCFCGAPWVPSPKPWLL